MEAKHRPRELPPDDAMRARVKKAGNVMMSGLAGVSALSVVQNFEKLHEPVPELVASQDLHGLTAKAEIPRTQVRDDKVEVSRDDSETRHSGEPAGWWPTGVKQHWLAIEKTAEQYNIDPYIVATIMAEESMGTNVDNPSGATGLMQIMPSTAQEIARRRHIAHYDMHNEQQNIDFACWLINYLNDNYIKKAGVELDSEMGVKMLAVGYGDGEGALMLWVNNGFSEEFLSAQARHVMPLWEQMHADRFNAHSKLFEQQRKPQ